GVLIAESVLASHRDLENVARADDVLLGRGQSDRAHGEQERRQEQGERAWHRGDHSSLHLYLNQPLELQSYPSGDLAVLVVEGPEVRGAALERVVETAPEPGLDRSEEHTSEL